MKYQICVSGAASGETVMASNDLAFMLGAEIARAGKTLLTGATTGLPHAAARGFKSVSNTKGVSVGFSPASSFREHVSTYRLPTVEFDYINFTSMDFFLNDRLHRRAYLRHQFVYCVFIRVFAQYLLKRCTERIAQITVDIDLANTNFCRIFKIV